MNEQRLRQLLEFYQEDPEDPFNIYALANEYRSSDINKSLHYYEMLINNHPEYVPTYYHLAHLYIDLQRDQDARLTFEKGIEKASKNHDQHALRELKSAYEEFMTE